MDNEKIETEDMEQPEEANEQAVEEALQDEVALETEVEELQKAVKESEEKYLRLMAEYDNYRKRTAKERDEIYPNATASTLERFLPVLDNFERALEYDYETEEFSQGIEMIYKNFQDVLESFGVEVIGEVGEPFDPEYHNGVMHIDDPEFGENVVSMVMQKGYKMGDRIIRHAMVQAAN